MTNAGHIISRIAGPALAAAAIAAPAASAQPIDWTPVSKPAPTARVVLPNPDTRDAARASIARTVLPNPDTRDFARGSGPGHFVVVQSPAVSTAAEHASGFDWADAGIGAGAALVLGLLGLAGGLGTRRRTVAAG